MTRVERLHAIVAKVWPAAMEQHAQNGSWPNRLEDPRKDEHSGAPYLITTLKNGGRRIQVHGAEGDVIGGQGANMDEALSVLETKLGLGDVA